MTSESDRVALVEGALDERKQQSGEVETETISWKGEPRVLPVVKLPIDMVLLNTRSHRIRAQLEDEPRGEAALADPWSDASQELASELLRKAHDDFESLRENLATEGQLDPGVVTRTGILINANTRCVALRDLGRADRQWIKVAVLPGTPRERELTELELELQVKEELKAEYPLTNQLLLIEDMARRYKRSTTEIAAALRWSPPKKVEQYRRILMLIREMQREADPPIPLTAFNDKLEQLKVLEKRYTSMFDRDPVEAVAYRRNWLVAALAGSSSVHDLRAVDVAWVDEFLRPRLADDNTVAPVLDHLLRKQEALTAVPRGVGRLDPDVVTEPPARTDVRPLLNTLVATDATVELPGLPEPVERENLVFAITRATKQAIRDKKAEDKAADRIDAPVKHLADGTQKLRAALKAYREVAASPTFAAKRRGMFSYELRRARKALSEVEAAYDQSADASSAS